jgi:hypothetical protein
MKTALALVALLGLVMGCNGTTESGDTSGDPGDSTTAATEGSGGGDSTVATINDAISISTASVTATTGSNTGGQVDGAGGSVGFGGEGGGAGYDGFGGEAGAENYPDNPYPAIAMTRAQRQALLEAGNAVSTTGSVQDDPDDLWVVIADTAMVCTEFPPFPACGGHWKVDLMLTQSMLQGGKHSLAGEWFGASYSDVAEDPNFPDICGGGGSGGGIEGFVEVLEFNESEISFRLHADPWSIDDDIDGIYTIPLCPR